MVQSRSAKGRCVARLGQPGSQNRDPALDNQAVGYRLGRVPGGVKPGEKVTTQLGIAYKSMQAVEQSGGY